MMTPEDTDIEIEKKPQTVGVEYRATIRFPKKDYEFMQTMIENGEYTNITEIVRDAVKRFRLEWTDMETVSNTMPMMKKMMGLSMMPMMKNMMNKMGMSGETEKDRKER